MSLIANAILALTSIAHVKAMPSKDHTDSCITNLFLGIFSTSIADSSLGQIPKIEQVVRLPVAPPVDSFVSNESRCEVFLRLIQDHLPARDRVQITRRV